MTIATDKMVVTTATKTIATDKMVVATATKTIATNPVARIAMNCPLTPIKQKVGSDVHHVNTCYIRGTGCLILSYVILYRCGICSLM